MTREEALKIVGKTHQWLRTDRGKEALETLIPELVESEDERIRKEIIEYLQRYLPTDELLKEQEMVAWLEKQEEQKSVERNEEDEKVRRWILEYFYLHRDELRGASVSDMDILNWLEKREESKRELPLPVRRGDTDAYFHDLRMTTKPLNSRGWFNEGMKYAQRIQKEQKPAEWSDEDKEIIANATKQLYSYADSYHNAGNYTREKEVRKVAYELKSLSPSWKPSKEQMEELYNAFYTHSVGAKSRDVLETLYNQLKKL